MAVRDIKLKPDSAVAAKGYTIPLDAVVATSKTGVRIAAIKPGHEFRLMKAHLYANGYTATVEFNISVVQGSGGIVGGDAGLAINSTATKFQTDAIDYVIGGVGYSKATTSAAGVAFSAAHVVTANKYGAILVQIDAAGTISTKVAASPQAADSAAEALLTLPSPDAGNLSLGYIVIAAGGTDFTANTTALTGLATYTDTPAITPAIAALAPVAGEVVESALPAIGVAHGNSDATIVVQMTTDGSGDITYGALTVGYRPWPLDGEYSLVST